MRRSTLVVDAGIRATRAEVMHNVVSLDGLPVLPRI
jgi:hypothetical protein